MNLLLVYATNSGSTFEVANQISGKLTEAGHQVNVKNVTEISYLDFPNYDVVILGSPSWDYEGQEGHPHQDFMNLINNTPPNTTYIGRKFAVFGLGDSNYTIFCGAVTHLTDYVTKLQGTLTCEPLRLDQYYNNMDTANQKISDWVTSQLLPKLE